MSENTLKNKVEISLYISKDFDGRPAVRKVSDKLTVLNCIFGGSQQGYAPVTVKVFSSTNVTAELKAGSAITVDGWFSVNSFTTKENKKISNLEINAREITATPSMAKDSDNSNKGQQSDSSTSSESNPWAANGGDADMWR